MTTRRRPEPWDPTPPDDTLMSRQEWLNMGGDIEMDEAEERSQEGQVISPASWMKPAKMEPDEPADADTT